MDTISGILDTLEKENTREAQRKTREKTQESIRAKENEVIFTDICTLIDQGNPSYEELFPYISQIDVHNVTGKLTSTQIDAFIGTIFSHAQHTSKIWKKLFNK